MKILRHSPPETEKIHNLFFENLGVYLLTEGITKSTFFLDCLKPGFCKDKQLVFGDTGRSYFHIETM